MRALLTDQLRLMMLVGLCGLLWSVESIVPLYRYPNSRVRHALPNVALTLILVLTNLALSFSSAYFAGLTARNGIGVFYLLGLSAWPQAVLGVVALNLFAYFAHVLLHKPGWAGSSIASIIRKTRSMLQPLFANIRAQRDESLEKFCFQIGIEVRHWLIQEQQLRAAHECPSQSHSLLFTA